MCVCVVDFICWCIVQLSSRCALYVFFFFGTTALVHCSVFGVQFVELFFIALCLCNSKLRRWINSVRFIAFLMAKSSKSHYTQPITTHTLRERAQKLRMWWCTYMYYLHRSEYEPLQTHCGFWFACCLLYKLLWNAHLSALMWHPDQMVFHVMTDHRCRRRRRRCRYTTHLYNILY